MIGEDPNTTIRVEAKGKIGGFNRELVGSELTITGIVRENRLSKEELEQWEKKVAEAEGEEDGSADHCGSETANINSIKDWMKKHNKDYHLTYFMDGLSYEVIE